MRRLALSYWSPILLGAVLLVVHVAWAVWWEPAKRGEIVTGFGACLIVLGLWVAARPYIREGLRKLTNDKAGFPPPSSLRTKLGAKENPLNIYIKDLNNLVEEGKYAKKLTAAGQDVIDERVIAVIVIAVGTLLNGYGPPLVRLFALEIPS